MSRQAGRKRQLLWALVAVLLVLQAMLLLKRVTRYGTIEEKASSMVATNKVFDDARVARLADEVMAGDMKAVASAVREGVDIRAVGRHGMTLTHYALRARQRRAQIMAQLLEAGADPVSLLSTGDNVPHYAAERDNADTDVVEVLMAHGIDANWRPPEGVYHDMSLLQVAIMGGNLAVVKLLVQRGADLNYLDPMGGSALHTALDGRSTGYKIGVYLVDSGIDLALKNRTDPSLKNPRSETALEKLCDALAIRRRTGLGWDSEAVEGYHLFVAALARRGARLACEL